MKLVRVPLHFVFPACRCISDVVATFAAVAHALRSGTAPPPDDSLFSRESRVPRTHGPVRQLQESRMLSRR